MDAHKRKGRYFLGDKYPDVYFTQQEAKCIFYFLRGYSYPKTGELLAISPRTVEYYARAMQKKLQCNSKKQLIEIVMNSSLLSYLDTISEENLIWDR